jgi:hypothetical protein
MASDSFPQVQQEAFKILRYELARSISLRLLTPPNIILEPSVILNDAAQQIVMHLRTFLVQGNTEKHGGEQIVEYPADWWQHFKQRWFPNWTVKRYPVKMTVVRVPQQITMHRVCPHIPISMDDSQRGYIHVRWLQDPYAY